MTRARFGRLGRVTTAVGSVMRLYSLAFTVPLAVALFYDARTLRLGNALVAPGVLVFLGGMAATFLAGSLMVWASSPHAADRLRDRDAYLTVGIGWLALCLVSMVPFMALGVLSSPVDAFFEAMSGLTTTGATVIGGDLDAVPKSLMVWRAFLQFVGGMGIIVLSVALLGRFTQGGGQLLQAEAPGPSVERITPRLAHTARLLWSIYAALAGALFVVLMGVLWRHGFGLKQTFYESLILTFTTVSTGGFGAHGESIAYFHDSILESVLVVFMLLSGMNFTLHYYAFRGSPIKMWRDPEWRFFMGTFAVALVLAAGLLASAGQSATGSIRASAFTIASLITSTGFTTANYDLWPNGAKLLLLIVMVTGASAGSTGGGIKHVRVLLMFKVVGSHVKRALHPRAVVTNRLGNRSIKPDTFMSVASFLFLFVAVWVIGAFLLLMLDPAVQEVADAFGASVSALSNMGPAFGSLGPTSTYAALTPFSKLLLATEMWFGRLEIFAALLIFMPGSWRI